MRTWRVCVYSFLNNWARFGFSVKHLSLPEWSPLAGGGNYLDNCALRVWCSIFILFELDCTSLSTMITFYVAQIGLKLN